MIPCTPSFFILLQCIAYHQYCMYIFYLLAVQRQMGDVVSNILYPVNIILYNLELILETWKVI